MDVGSDWTELEIRRFLNRVSKLEKAGIDGMDAEYVAQQMLYRDRPASGDDRRICFECRHLESQRFCGIAGKGVMKSWKKSMEPLRATLQRCEGFEILKVVKS